MDRLLARELLEEDGVSEADVSRSYREMGSIHRWLGDTSLLLGLLRRSEDVRLVLDIGCGQGALLEHIRDELHLDVVGMDLRPPPVASRICILTGNAVCDALPAADVAVCVCLAHHLSESELSDLIANVGRFCRRFIVLDLVRHWAPLVLFRLFVAPLLGHVSAHDGATSIRRAYTAAEMRRIVDQSLRSAGRPVLQMRHTVGPFWIHQVVDISWAEQPAELSEPSEEETSARR